MELRPPSWVLVPMVGETVLRLVKAGHVIVVGQRGGGDYVGHGRGVPRPARRLAAQADGAGAAAAFFLTRQEAARFTENGRSRLPALRGGPLPRPVSRTICCITWSSTPTGFRTRDAARLVADGARRCFKECESSQDGEHDLKCS